MEFRSKRHKMETSAVAFLWLVCNSIQVNDGLHSCEETNQQNQRLGQFSDGNALAYSGFWDRRLAESQVDLSACKRLIWRRGRDSNP